MSIINKLRRTEEPHLPVHGFSWVLHLWLLGDLTSGEAVAALGAEKVAVQVQTASPR